MKVRQMLVCLFLGFVLGALTALTAVYLNSQHQRQLTVIQLPLRTAYRCRPRPKKRGHWKQSPLLKSSNSEDWLRFLKKWHDQLSREELTHWVLTMGLSPECLSDEPPSQEEKDFAVQLAVFLQNHKLALPIKEELEAWSNGRVVLINNEEFVGPKDSEWSQSAVYDALRRLNSDYCPYCNARDSIVDDDPHAGWPYCGSCQGV